MFGKKKTPEQMMREQDRELRRVNRGLERDRGKMNADEKKLELEIKKAAKAGNKQACAILAKQLVQMRKQKNRSYTASSQITSVGMHTKAMHTNMKMANAMGKTAKTMSKVNKQMDPQKMAQTMAQFERENAKMEMSEEMINDTMDSVLAGSDDEAEQDSVINQVLGEIGIEMSGKMAGVSVPKNNLTEPEEELDVHDIEKKLAALRSPAD